MTDIRILSIAEDEFTESLCWYADRSKRAAERLDEEFGRVLESIALDPERFPL